MIKFKKVFLVFVSLFLLSSCDLIGINGTGTPGGNGSGGNCSSGNCTTGAVDIDAINKYFATGSRINNPSMIDAGGLCVLIPFNHINGPKEEWEFFAIVNFQANYDDYTRYQVTYLSCTCRSSDINFWQTMYVELKNPDSGQLDDIKISKICFDEPVTVDDKTGEKYVVGFWGDSGIDDASKGHMGGVKYEDIKTGFIPYLETKTYGDIKDAQVTKDGWNNPHTQFFYGLDEAAYETWASTNNIKVKGQDTTATLSDFSGASVSTNNIIRVIQALCRYHATKL